LGRSPHGGAPPRPRRPRIPHEHAPDPLRGRPQYEADSAPALAIKATIERTEKRFANYAKAGLLCGNDGLPHLISDPGLALKYGHAGEVFVSCPGGGGESSGRASAGARSSGGGGGGGSGARSGSSSSSSPPPPPHPCPSSPRPRANARARRPPQIPTFGFLYVAGWIGYVGRQYLNKVKGEAKPTEKEIIIDVPAALKMSAEGFGWPLRVVNELRAGTLTEKAENITISPR
jgi:hypothetical protein